MASEHKAELLEEAVGPHLETDEGQNFIAGQATMDGIRVGLFFSFPKLTCSCPSL